MTEEELDDLIRGLDSADLTDQNENNDEIPFPATVLVLGVMLCCTIVGAVLGIPMIILAAKTLMKK